MKTIHKLALATLTGMVMGGAGMVAIHAQQTKVAPAYIIAEVEVTDPTALQEYAKKAPATLAAYGGHYLVAGGTVQALEGEAPKGYVVVLAFDSMEKAIGWYNSPAYDAVKPIRQHATKSRLILAEGLVPK